MFHKGSIRLGKALTSKVVLITGGAGGLGLALAVEAAALGAKLAILDLSLEGLEAAEVHLKNAFPDVQISLHAIDVSQPSLWENTIKDVVASHGTIDILINNAGVTLAPQPVEDVSPALYDKVVAVNLLGAIYAVRACLPLILKSSCGGVINISSLAGRLGLYGYNPYSVSKFGLRGLGESLQMEFAGTAQHCLNVYPGGIRTSLMNNALGLTDDKRKAAHMAFMKQPSLMPQSAAKRIWGAFLAQRLDLIMGIDAWAIILIRRWFGKWGLKILKKALLYQARVVR